jgi:hypothetical protein
MNGIVEAALELQEWLIKSRQQLRVIGGLAVIRWGEHRGTRDVDVSVFVDFGEEQSFAGRGRDRGDVRGILVQQKGQLNDEMIVPQLNELCLPTGDLAPGERLRQMMAEPA